MRANVTFGLLFAVVKRKTIHCEVISPHPPQAVTLVDINFLRNFRYTPLAFDMCFGTRYICSANVRERNPTEKPIYLKVEGEKIVLLPNSGIEL